MRKINPQISEQQQKHPKQNSYIKRKFTSRHLIIKLQNAKDKKNILKAATEYSREKNTSSDKWQLDLALISQQ